MTCRSVEPHLVDLARDAGVDAVLRVKIDRHLAECGRCAARLAEERELSRALGRLAREAENVPPNPRSEQALLAAFDAAWTRPSAGIVDTRRRIWQPLAAAAVLLLTAAGIWTIASRRPHAPDRATLPPVATAAPIEGAAVQPAFASAPDTTPAATKPATIRGHRPAAKTAAVDTTPFVMWPGADTLPRFESGHLMRLDLPASMAISLGLTLSSSRADVVRADVLIGQDGLARAVRVAP